MAENTLIINKVHEEEYQHLGTRKRLYERIEAKLGLPLVAYFGSFRYHVMMEDSDADMLMGLLQKMDTSKGLALMINSAGGWGLTAERIINICRSQSATGEYVAIIVGKAKSAATMVCLGASKLIMGKNAELGPIDPQIVIEESGKVKPFSVCNIVKSYEELFNKAVKEKGNIQPYLQQLANYDAREIEEFRNAIALSEDIAIKALKTGMMKNKSEEAIKKEISIFLTPEKVKVHGRPIYALDAEKSGLSIEVVTDKELWKWMYELYFRLDNFVSTQGRAKCIESRGYSFQAKIKEK